MGTAWTPERKQRQREAIQKWKPWEKSTGPRTDAGKLAACRNAYTGGLWLEVRVMLKRTTQVIKELKAAGNWPPRL